MGRALRVLKNMENIKKIIFASTQCQKCVDAGPEFLWQCSRDSEIIKFYILQVSLSLTSSQRNTPNYEENDGFF